MNDKPMGAVPLGGEYWDDFMAQYDVTAEDEMSDLQPGPELDNLIAHKVMGTGTIIMGHPVLVDESLPPGNFRFTTAPPYSTDMAAAWQVVEKVGLGFNLIRGRLSKECTVEFIIDGSVMGGAQARTPAHAICLAALKAVEVLT